MRYSKNDPVCVAVDYLATPFRSPATPALLLAGRRRALVVRHCRNQNVSQRHPPNENEHAANLGGLAAFRRPRFSAEGRSSRCYRDRRSGARRRSLSRAASKGRQASPGAAPCYGAGMRHGPPPVPSVSPCSSASPGFAAASPARGRECQVVSRACGAICRERECLMVIELCPCLPLAANPSKQKPSDV